MTGQALSGLIVLDLSQNISGPFCTRLLAGLGAEVIKIEPPGQGDPSRKMGPFPGDEPHSEKSGLFLYLNTGKKSLTLNLKTRAGAKIFKKLAREADMVVENFEPKVMPGLGLNYQELEKINPALIMTSISYFGQNGPYRDYQATNLTAYALGGIAYVTGDPDREPLTTGGSQAEYHGGLNAFVATLTALHYRDVTGIGQHVDVSLMECLVSVLEYKLEMYSFQGAIAGRWHSRHPYSWPHGDIYPCRDGFVGVISGPPRRWAAAARLMANPALADPRFADSGGITAHRDEVDAHLLPWLIEHDKEEIYHSAQALGLPFGYVATTEDLLNSAQFRERGFFAEIDHPEAGTLAYPTSPAKMSETPWQTGRAPLLGEHNEEIYKDIGVSSKRLATLKEAGVI